MAAAEEDAWWDGLPDQIEDWDAPLPVPIASPSTGRRKLSGEKASLQAILVKAERRQVGVTPPPQVAAGVHGGRGGASEPVAGEAELGPSNQASPAVQQTGSSPLNVAPIVSSFGASTRPPGADLPPPHSVVDKHTPQNRGHNFREQRPYSDVAPPIPPVNSDGVALSEEQRSRIDANRMAALRRRNAAAWYQAAHTSPGISIPTFQQTAPCQACRRNGGSAEAAESGGAEVNIEDVDASKTELRNGLKPEVGSEKPSNSPEYEVPEDFWDDVDEGQGGNSGGERQTAANSSDVNRPLRGNSLSGLTAPASANIPSEGVFINSAARGVRSAYVQPMAHPHQRVLPAFCNAASSHQPDPNPQFPQSFQQIPEPLNIPVMPQGPEVIPRPLEVSLELQTVDLLRVSVQYAFCEPPIGSVFAPDSFENPEQRTRSVLERACPGVLPQKWVSDETLDSEGFLVFPIVTYDAVLRALSKVPEANVAGIPESTLRALRVRWGPAESAGSGSNSAKEEITKGDLVPGDPSGAQSPVPPIKRPCDSSWRPLKSWHIGDEEVDALMEQGLPAGLRKTLLPFQWEGVRYGLRRGGRCLIADEMGVGKTIQGIAIASCYRAEWPLLVVVPASMRLPWAEELERWLPFLGPRDVHLVFSFQNDLQEGVPCPKVVVISYTMLRRLKRTFAAHKWGVLIVDESHNLRTTKNPKETEEKETVKEFLQKTKRAVLLSGTPSLNRPFDIFHQADGLWTGLLGRTKYVFAKAYCDVRTLRRGCGNIVKDYSKGARLHELHVLLAETVMVRRLKSDVLDQLPPKRRQVIRLKLEAGDIKDAKERTAQLAAELAAMGKVRGRKFARMEARMLEEESEEGGEEEEALRRLVEGGDVSGKEDGGLTYQQIGLAKLRGVREWLANNVGLTPQKEEGAEDVPKMIIFAHHIEVLDRIQRYVHDCGVAYVRIDGSTLGHDRQAAVQDFKHRDEIRVAIVGVTAGGVGLDFSAAQTVVLAAEDRAHRRGQSSAVNVYLFCAKDTDDETSWMRLSESLERVTTVVNGSENAVRGIHVDAVEDKASGQNIRTENAETDDWGATQWEGGVGFGCRTGPPGAEKEENGEEKDREEGAGDGTEKVDEPGGGMEAEIDPPGNGKFVSASEETSAKPHEEAEAGSSKGEEENGVAMDDQDFPFAAPSGDGETKARNAAEAKVTENSSDKVRILTPPGVRRRSFPIDGTPPDERRGGKRARKSLFPSSQGPVFDVFTRAGGDAKAGEKGGEDDGGVPVGKLLFEISPNTGRVHLYRGVKSGASGGGGAELLGLNFPREELAKLKTEEDVRSYQGPLPKLLLTCGAHLRAARQFLDEWTKLRPIFRSKLQGMPLKAPLELELEKVRGGATGGLRAGGSKKRVAARDEVGEPLPAGASMRGVEWRSIFGEPQKSNQGLDEDGNPLCKMCQKICRGRFAKFPKKMADLFCSPTCADQYSTRTSSAHNRRRLFELERGVCSMCNLDCHKMVTTLKGLSNEQRRKSILEMAPAFLDYPKRLDYLLANFNEGNAWHADHIVAVYEGGGECDLKNLRTLCVPCHSKVTSLQTKRRASEARLAKNDDPKQRKLSFVPRVKKKRPAEFVDLGSDEEASPPAKGPVSPPPNAGQNERKDSPEASADQTGPPAAAPAEASSPASLNGSHSSAEELLQFDFRKTGPEKGAHRLNACDMDVVQAQEASDRDRVAYSDSGTKASDRSERHSDGVDSHESTAEEGKGNGSEKGEEATRRPPPLKRGKRSVDDLLKCKVAGKSGSQVRGTAGKSAGRSKGVLEGRPEESVVRGLAGDLDVACGGSDISRSDPDGGTGAADSGMKGTNAGSKDSDRIVSRSDGTIKESDQNGSVADSAETDRTEQTESAGEDGGEQGLREGGQEGRRPPPLKRVKRSVEDLLKCKFTGKCGAKGTGRGAFGGLGKGGERKEKKGEQATKVGKERKGSDFQCNRKRLLEKDTRIEAVKEDSAGAKKGTRVGLETAVKEGVSASKEGDAGDSDGELFAAIERFKKRTEMEGRSRG
ncbi:SNF2 domain containing protein [Klebsormidium nitens]|uniref:SNF2 domain containing protein n=1 Tax=Klebsormidium nitens TaxID=105231 RepID=A0A1Y1HVS3_KLENI|nr:SNF2 domain containing protein [Klebsormidium nitens]|eukprot:GAQ80637.1 SNF2 domain containing protein [Klebsormidium nitens]